MVRPFEDRAFTIGVGDVSDIFRTQFGYHILTVHDRIDMPAPRELAHIMIRPKGPTPADSAAAEQRVDEVASALADGTPFEELAAEYSDDPNSARNRGIIGVLAPRPWPAQAGVEFKILAGDPGRHGTWQVCRSMAGYCH